MAIIRDGNLPKWARQSPEPALSKTPPWMRAPGADDRFGMSLEQQLSSAKAQLKAEQAKLKIYQSQKAHLKKPDPKDKKAVAKYKAQQAKYDAIIKASSARIKDLGIKIPQLQNKYYESTGQYDKLLTGSNRDAFLALKSLFDSYGLGSLADKIY